jgi:hypothetical protein
MGLQWGFPASENREGGAAWFRVVTIARVWRELNCRYGGFDCEPASLSRCLFFALHDKLVYLLAQGGGRLLGFAEIGRDF